MADAEPPSSSPFSIPRDVFGNIELLTPKAHPREYGQDADESSMSPLFTPIRATPSRAGSRRTQSVDIPARPSPLGPASRRKRGERERDKLRAELDAAASALTLDPRIAHDVLDLERRFAAASKGKSPARPHRTHKPRHSLPASHAPVAREQPLSTLAESGTLAESNASHLSSGHELVGPALPSSAVQSLAPSPPRPPSSQQPPSDPEPPMPIKVDKPAYPSLLPSVDSDAPSDVKRTSKAAKRHSFTAMLGLGSRKKHKDDEDKDKLSSPGSLRPSPKRIETHHTARTFNTMLTTHTGATAGSIEAADQASTGIRSVSATSSNPGPIAESPIIEPSAKTLARAAATRDQLSKRYGVLYASLGDPESEQYSSRSVSGGSGSILKRASPGPSLESPRRDRRPLNPLEVVRWRSGVLSRARQNAEAERERKGEAWERETERRVRDGFPVPVSLGDSLPEANSLSWLPYLEPVFAEERERKEGAGEFGMATGLGSSGSVGRMSAWYILASFVEGYLDAKEHDERVALEELGVRGGSFGSDGFKSVGSDPKSMASDRPTADSHHSKPITSDVRAQAIVNSAYARGSPDAHVLSDDASGSRFAAVSRALRGAGSRRDSVIEGVRSRQSSFGLGNTSEPPSPSHVPPGFLGSSSTSQLSHPGARGLGFPGTANWLAPKSEGRPAAHSRSQSQSRSISAGNPGLKPGVEFNPRQTTALPGESNGKSMSPASSRLNLANFIIGGAAALGLNMRRTGHARRPLSKDGPASGSENESARMSSDVSDLRSDGEGGRIKRRRKTWREREQGSVPLSDGGAGVDAEVDVRRRSLRLEKRIILPIEASPERSGSGKEGKESEYAKKQTVVENAHETLDNVDFRLHSFTQFLDRLNAVHKQGSDVFGEMFMDVPQQVVDILTPELSEDGRSSLDSTRTTPTLALRTFADKLEGMEEIPTKVDHIGRSTLDASLPIAAFDALHELEHELGAISRGIVDLRRICGHTERERQAVRHLYEKVAGSVGTTYPECQQIEQLLGSLVTEDMPWLPSWLPLWVRHLLEIFSNQIQFLVENGLRIYGYAYALVSLFVVVFTLVFRLVFFLSRFVRSYWWGFLAAALAVVAYLMVYRPEGVVPTEI